MRTRLPASLCCALAVLSPAPAQERLSDKTRAEIAAGLPRYDPNPPQETKAGPSSPVGTPAPLSDDPLVQMPTFEVHTRRATDPGSDGFLTKEAIRQQTLKDYRNSMSALGWLLNCFYIPLLTPSPQARADEAYRERHLSAEMESIASLADALSKLDPEAARKLQRDMDLDRHPTN